MTRRRTHDRRATARRLGATALLAGLTTAAPASADEAYRLTEVLLDPADHLRLADLDGDGRLDLVRVGTAGVAVHRLRDDGTLPVDPDATYRWDAPSVGWQLADVDGDGRHALVVLRDRRLVLVRLGPDGFAEDRELIGDARTALPRGTYRVPFAQDIDDDGRADYVLPVTGGFSVHRTLDDGSLAPGIRLAADVDVEQQFGAPGRVDGRFRQRVRIPWFSLRDVDGDGHADLVSETEGAVRIHLARPGFDEEPTWRLDLRDSDADEETTPFELDFDDLLAGLDDDTGWKVADLDGAPPNDLVLQADGVFRVYLDGSVGDIARPPDQLLKVSGNVLHFLLRDVTGDGRPDLQVLRGPRLSVGDVLGLLVLPGGLDVDVYTYVWADGSFGKRPARRARVRLEIPGLLDFAEEMEAVTEPLPPAVTVRTGSGPERDGVVDVQQGRLLVVAGAVPDDLAPSVIDRVASTELDDLLETFLLSDLDALEDGATRTLSLTDLRTLDITNGRALRLATIGREPLLSVDVGCREVRGIRTPDVDGDGLEDVVLVGERSDGETVLWLLVARR